jgi:hypothetical protein
MWTFLSLTLTIPDLLSEQHWVYSWISFSLTLTIPEDTYTHRFNQFSEALRQHLLNPDSVGNKYIHALHPAALLIIHLGTRTAQSTLDILIKSSKFPATK